MRRTASIAFATAATVCWFGQGTQVGADVPLNQAVTPPLTSLEQAGRLAALTYLGLGRELHPRPTRSLAPQWFFQRDYHSRWMESSSFERTLLAERIGNQGRARFAAEQGWTKLLGSQHRGIRQGPDAAYWNRSSGRLFSLEAKGGSSPLRWSYGSRQATIPNTLRSADFVLGSARSTRAEKLASALIVVAAQQRRLISGVVRTPHALGQPGVPRFYESIDQPSVSSEARAIQKRLLQTDPLMRPLFHEAQRNFSASVWKHRIARHGGPGLGLAGAMMISLQAAQETHTAWAMLQHPAQRSTPLPYLHGAIAVGKWGEASALGVDAAAGFGLLKGGWRLSGRAAGQWFLPIAVGVEGLTLTTGYYEFSTGRIGHREFYRRGTNPAIFLTFASGGAAIGVWVGGVGAIPGATIGALVAVPVQYFAGWAWDRSDDHLSASQRKVVDLAVERLYGLRP